MRLISSFNPVVTCQTYTDIFDCRGIVQYVLHSQLKLATNQNVSLRK